MMEILAEMLKEAGVGEIDKVVFLSLGRLGPLFANVEFNLAEKLMIKAVAVAYGIEEKEVKKEFKEKGDLGLVVEENLADRNVECGMWNGRDKKNHKTKKYTSHITHHTSLTGTDVYERLLMIAKEEGKGSQERKIGGIGKLLRSLDPISAKYIVRIPLKKMRLGFSDKTILDALSFMEKGDKSAKKQLEDAYKVRPDIGLLARVVKEKGIKGVAKLREPEVGVPILMAQAKRMSSAEEILLKIGKCAVEPKIDGFRCITGYTPLYLRGKGYISARNVKAGDYVLTHKGRYKRIIAINKRKVDKGEKVYAIQTYLSNEFKISEGHKVLVWRSRKPEWIPIEQVDKKDVVVFPRPLLTEYSRNGLIGSCLHLSNVSGYKKTIKIDLDFYRFLGFWVGDGFSNNYHNTERVGLHFNARKEKKLAAKYKKIIENKFGIKEITETVRKGTLTLYWRDKPFRQWLTRFFRREWKGKMIPEWFAGITKEQFQSFLKGWIESDGSLCHSGGYKIVTKERDLASFAQLIALHHGIPAGVKKFRQKISSTGFVGTYYQFYIPGTKRRIRIEDNHVITEILRCRLIDRDPRMTLYNLQVEDDESYCTGLVSLHNCQIHKTPKSIYIFTRNLDDVTYMYPDIVEAVKRQIRAESAIFEGEAVAFNPETKEYLPFQETVQRKRKYDIEKFAKDVPLKLIAFELLYLNGKNLLNKPYRERRKLLGSLISTKASSRTNFSSKQNLPPPHRRNARLNTSSNGDNDNLQIPRNSNNGNGGGLASGIVSPEKLSSSEASGAVLNDISRTIILAEEHEVENEGVLEKLFNKAVGEGLEGVMAKRLDAPYTAGARNWNWIKYKRSYSGELADTLDCLVLGYDYGKGKRAQFGIGGFLVGVYDEKRGVFKTVSKIGTGLSDEQWRGLKLKCQNSNVKSRPKEYKVAKEADVDVWVAPSIVVEIEADEITKSPVHTAGLALRFPRLKRFRDDKRPEQATTIAELKDMYKQQKKHKVR
jgi:ATP-dependent DNA ligase